MRQPLIVVVDDSPNIRKAIQMSLESCGYPTITAASGIEALNLLEAHPSLALVLIDINMPGMSGFDAIQLITARKYGHRVSICLMSGSSQVENVAKAAKLGVFDYIVKPIDEEILLTKVKRLIGDPNAPRTMTSESELKEQATPSRPAASERCPAVIAHLCRSVIHPDLKIVALSVDSLTLHSSAAVDVGARLELGSDALEKVPEFTTPLLCRVKDCERHASWGFFILTCEFEGLSATKAQKIAQAAGLPLEVNAPSKRP